MEFDKFVNKLKREFNNKLPGFNSQIKAAPKSRDDLNNLVETDDPKKSAVLILLYPENDKIYIPFIKRVTDGSMHSGQIAFPGGKFEQSDKNMKSTALREAEEEIGIDQNKVKVLKELTPLYIPVSNYLVWPYVGVADKMPDFVKSDSEVDVIFKVNIKELCEANIVYKEFSVRNTSINAPFFILKDIEIWGATAMILSEFIDILRNAFRK